MFGVLIFHDNRPDIALEDGTLYGGLHCGDCFRYYEDGWSDVRLEYTDSWILVQNGKYKQIKYGAQVSI